MDDVLRAEGLAKTYRVGFWRRKVRALQDATFRVAPGEVFGLVGGNGAGKTTTIKLLTGLITPDRGRGTVLGEPIGSVRGRQRLGYLPEAPYFYEYLTVAELLDFYGVLFGVPARVRAKRIDELIEKVGLNHARDRQLRKYSKGMLQRAGIAQTLIHDPTLVILDEPKTGLDPLGRAEVTELILDLKRRGRSVFFSSHILSDVERVCDRIAVMVRGRVVKVGRLDELLDAHVTRIEVVFDGLDVSFCDAVSETLGVTWRALNPERTVFSCMDTEAGRMLVSRALAEGAALRGYDEHRESLEDLFVRETREGNLPGDAIEPGEVRP